LLASLITCANLLADHDESDGEEGQAYREALAAITEAIGAENSTVDTGIDAILTARCQVAVIWGIEDVLKVRPDLTDEQCWEVLQQTRRYHDAGIGINWDVLSCHADMLFGPGPEGADPDEED
jgi:hypothetical protein